jgi:hypothetical protein
MFAGFEQTNVTPEDFLPSIASKAAKSRIAPNDVAIPVGDENTIGQRLQGVELPWQLKPVAGQ